MRGRAAATTGLPSPHPRPPPGRRCPPPARRGARRSARTMDFIRDLAGWRRGCQGWGTSRVPPQRGRGALRQLPRVCTRVHMHIRSQVCTHIHTRRAKPPTHLQAPRTLPARPSAAGSTRCPWKGGGGGGWQGAHRSGVRPAPPSTPPPHYSLAMQEEGSRHHTGHPTAGREKGCCAQRRLMGRGCWGGTRGSGGVADARGTTGCRAGGGGGCGRAGRGTACSGRAAPREHVPCGKGGAQALAKTVIPSPKWRAWTPDMGGPPQPGCHPRPGRGSWSPFV